MAETGRVLKLPDVRKGELVACAQALFVAKGYENTTVADIIARAGISKGGFYHHFESKEDLLDAVIRSLVADVIAHARDVLDDPGIDALTKLNRFFARSQQWKSETTPHLRGIYTALFKPENAQLYQRIVSATVTSTGPVLTRIIEQGVREKVFDVPDPEIVAELLMHIANARYAVAAEAMAKVERGEIDEATALISTRARREEAIVNRLLGLVPGSVRIIDDEQAHTIMAALR